jgi:Brp/Blh family beta-carotene 15,15'-monooxygenase
MSPIYQKTSYALIIICLFLILIIGISHGSLDNIKGEKLFKSLGYSSRYLFYMSYIFISLLIIFSWLILPNLILLIFLIVASYHFGKEDTVFKVKKRLILNEILFFFKGSSIIIAPLLFQRDSTNEIFASLNFYVFENTFFNDFTLIIFLILSFLSSVFLSIDRSINLKSIMILDFFSIIILNLFLTPILAFTLYFCFLHSVRHSFSLINELDRSFRKGFKKFIMKAIPLTLITGLIFLISIYFLNNLYKIDEAIYKVIFIGLASLTFPHILLEYLLEKNEKRT